MFGLFKAKTFDLEPLEFDVTVDVDAPAERVYALIDWADPGNAKRELGNHVEALDPSGTRFLLIMTAMPDLRFEMTVSDADRPRSYAFTTEITPPIGRLDWSKEHYTVEPVGPDTCKLRQTVTVKFNDGLTMRQAEEELAKMHAACTSAIVKLKVHAEQGAQTVAEFERQQFGG